MTSLTTAWPAARRRAGRGRRLTSANSRRRLAQGLERLVQDADRPAYLRGSAAPINRAEIRRCADLIHDLAEELGAEQPPPPRGVELVEHLLRDGASPVYEPELEGALEPALRHARAALLLR
jgi:hypothetical protein